MTQDGPSETQKFMWQMKVM